MDPLELEVQQPLPAWYGCWELNLHPLQEHCEQLSYLAAPALCFRHAWECYLMCLLLSWLRSCCFCAQWPFSTSLKMRRKWEVGSRNIIISILQTGQNRLEKWDASSKPPGVVDSGPGGLCAPSSSMAKLHPSWIWALHHTKPAMGKLLMEKAQQSVWFLSRSAGDGTAMTGLILSGTRLGDKAGCLPSQTFIKAGFHVLQNAPWCSQSWQVV